MLDKIKQIKSKITNSVKLLNVKIKNVKNNINKDLINEVILFLGLGFIITSFYLLNTILGLFMTGVMLIAYSLLNN